GYGCLRIEANEQIGLEGDKFGCENRYALGMVLDISVFDDQVLSLDPSVIAQALLQRFVKGGRGRPASIILETSKNTDPARLSLPPRMPWANEQSRSIRNELSPPHLITQWITEALGEGTTFPAGRRWWQAALFEHMIGAYYASINPAACRRGARMK